MVQSAQKTRRPAVKSAAQHVQEKARNIFLQLREGAGLCGEPAVRIPVLQSSKGAALEVECPHTYTSPIPCPPSFSAKALTLASHKGKM